MAKHFPYLESKPLQPNDLKAMYIPVWFIDGEVTGETNCFDIEVRRIEIVQRGRGLMSA